MTAIVSLLSLNSLADNTNSIEIHQVTGVTADNLDLNITQIGYNNKVNLSIAHDNNSLLFKQEGNNNKISWVDYWGSGLNWGGDLDGSGNNLHFEQECTRGAGNCSQSVIGFHINHPNNSVRWGQGRILTDIDDTTFTTDGDEGGGHRLNLDIHGEDNKLAGYQRNGSLNNYDGHTATIYFYSDDNEFFVKQEIISDNVVIRYIFKKQHLFFNQSQIPIFHYRHLQLLPSLKFIRQFFISHPLFFHLKAVVVQMIFLFLSLFRRYHPN